MWLDGRAEQIPRPPRCAPASGSSAACSGSSGSSESVVAHAFAEAGGDEGGHDDNDLCPPRGGRDPRAGPHSASDARPDWSMRCAIASAPTCSAEDERPLAELVLDAASCPRRRHRDGGVVHGGPGRGAAHGHRGQLGRRRGWRRRLRERDQAGDARRARSPPRASTEPSRPSAREAMARGALAATGARGRDLDDGHRGARRGQRREARGPRVPALRLGACRASAGATGRLPGDRTTVRDSAGRGGPPARAHDKDFCVIHTPRRVAAHPAR